VLWPVVSILCYSIMASSRAHVLEVKCPVVGPLLWKTSNGKSD
jgi:hypothetical protein